MNDLEKNMDAQVEETVEEMKLKIEFIPIVIMITILL